MWKYVNLLLGILIPGVHYAQVLSLNGVALPAAGGAPSNCTAGSYKTVNSAAVSGNCVTFTTGSFQNGAIWACSQINLNQSFKLSFQINFGSNQATGDGMAFLLMAEGVPQVIGGRAGGLGYAQGDGANCQGGTCPVTPSVAVEFDTWDNSNVGLNDIACNHLSIQKDGNMLAASSLFSPVCLLPGGSSVVDGMSHNVCIVWDPSLNLYSTFFDGAKISEYAGNIRTNFIDPASVYWGFTGASGGQAQTQSICNVTLLTNITAPSCPCTTAIWSGITNSIWGEVRNWGGCSSPDCPASAVINSTAVNQPVLLSGQIYKVNSITINPGATLTMQANSVLEICGNYNNLGTLTAAPGSTIRFVGANAQTISGALTGSNRFPNLVVDKTANTVLLNSDLDIVGDFSTINSTSVFNMNSRYVKLAGSFSNFSGNTTFTNPGTLEFNGTTLQNYNQGATQLDLKTVLMNNTGVGSGLNLLTNLCLRAADGQLNLTAGKIITGAANEVRQFNSASASVTVGNTTSYVEGFLRRKLVSPAVAVTYDFPVGHASKGYQLASILFNSNQNIDNLLASFTPYSILPTALMSRECNRFYNFSALDNGKWVIDAYNSSFGRIAGLATYDMTLYNRSFSNAGSCNAWTIMKDSIGAGAWYLNGTCDTTSTASIVRRKQVSGFSHFGTAQGGITLPVELILFEGFNQGGSNFIRWTTASESNNDHFTLERSAEGVEFANIARIAGAGTTNEVHYYEFTDEQPLHGTNYYRLVQSDFDGNADISHVIAIKPGSGLTGSVQLHPNPSQGIFFIDMESSRACVASVQVSELTGRIVYRQAFEIGQGFNSLKVDLGDLAKGFYSIQLLNVEGTGISSTHLLLQRD